MDEQQATAEAERILDEAKQQAEEIVNTAHHHARTILNDARQEEARILDEAHHRASERVKAAASLYEQAAKDVKVILKTAENHAAEIRAAIDSRIAAKQAEFRALQKAHAEAKDSLHGTVAPAKARLGGRP